jgi:predicted nucleotidyltransferase
MKIKNKIAEFFFLNPTTKLRVRQIERKVKVPLPSVIRYTKELEKEGILKSSLIANIKVYSADRNSKTFLLEKKIFNVRELFYSGLIDFLVKELSNPPVMVFGSYSKGEDIERSDIDLFIETPSKKKINLKRFEEKLRRRIQLFINKNICGIKNKELANNMINGIILNGYLEVFK